MNGREKSHSSIEIDHDVVEEVEQELCDLNMFLEGLEKSSDKIQVIFFF